MRKVLDRKDVSIGMEDCFVEVTEGVERTVYYEIIRGLRNKIPMMVETYRLESVAKSRWQDAITEWDALRLDSQQMCSYFGSAEAGELFRLIEVSADKCTAEVLSGCHDLERTVIPPSEMVIVAVAMVLDVPVKSVEALSCRRDLSVDYVVNRLAASRKNFSYGAAPIKHFWYFSRITYTFKLEEKG